MECRRERESWREKGTDRQTERKKERDKDIDKKHQSNNKQTGMKQSTNLQMTEPYYSRPVSSGSLLI